MSNGYPNHMFGNRLQAQHYQGGSLGSNHMLYGMNTPTGSLQSTGSLGSQSLGPFYSKQMEAAAKARMASSPHHHARIAATQSRMQNMASSNTTQATLSSDQNVIPRAAPSLENSSWQSLDLGGMMINHLNNALFSYTFLTALYLNHNNLTSLPAAISKLRNLATLNVTGNKLTSLPVELGLVVSLKELLVFDNQLTYIPSEYGTLYQLELIGLEGNPISEPIASMLTEKGTAAVIKYLRDSCPCPPPPGEREWIEVEENVPESEEFTIMCYNTLCEKYATPQTYGYTPSWALSWEYRKDLLLQEILNYSADIVCLQEVEMGQFEDFFKEQLSKLASYDGLFFPKSRHRTMGEYERRQVDGCATLYNTSKFKLLEKQHIEFQQIAMQRPDLHRSEDVLNRVMIKDNIAVLTLLERKETGEKVLVANAHLHWDPVYSDVKVIQTALLLDEVEKMVGVWSKRFQGASISVILCGDFNSLPDSGPVELLAYGSISPDHKELQGFNYSPFADRGLNHGLKLKSSYALCDDIEFTNFTPMFKGIIDYIWYDSSSMIITGLLGGIDKVYASKTVGFPNPHHPSDHIPLVVSIRIKNNSNSNKKISFK